jgi:hypothetical protein
MLQALSRWYISQMKLHTSEIPPRLGLFTCSRRVTAVHNSMETVTEQMREELAWL